ncbi:sigma-E factor negative regulatory protein [Stenotrophomonas maltophilia]|uniref:sigma-E factor negative regulatory protein n=1 Tax=Stenotrophomonas maltophilia TaxID=40324 RepID=UPI003BA22716
MSNDASRGASPDKFDAHYRQQLSSLIDGELSADEARFMLRRLEHDESLSSCNERWQMLGDVLRGQACAPAPMDFADRVRASVASEPAPVMQARVERGPDRQERRGGWRRWGGGAALAASVAAVAMFMTREQLPAPAPLDAPTTIIASQAELPAAPVTEAWGGGPPPPRGGGGGGGPAPPPRRIRPSQPSSWPSRPLLRCCRPCRTPVPAGGRIRHRRWP